MYVLTGTDEYLKASALRILKSKIAFPEMNVLALESPTAVELRDALTAFPMMSDYRLVQVDTVTDVSALGNYAESPNRTSVLVVTNPFPNAGKKESKAAEAVRRFLAKAEEIDCSPLDERTIFGWIAAESKKYDVQVERGAASLLAEYCRNDMSRISSEFGKLASYRIGGTVTEADVRASVEPELDFAVWQLSGAVAAGNGKEAFRIFGSFDDNAKAPEILFGVLYNHFRKLYYASVTEDEALLKKELGMRDNALFAVRREAAKFGAERLKRILLALAESDEEIKNGVIPREMASEILILKTLGEM